MNLIPDHKRMPFAVVSDRHYHAGQPVEPGAIIHLTPAQGARQTDIGNVRPASPADIKAAEDKAKPAAAAAQPEVN
jgi:hypothetical protein